MSTETDPQPRVVVGVDGSDGSKQALRWAARIAATENARIDAVSAWDFPTVGWGALPSDYSPQSDIERLLAETVDEVFGVNRPADMRLATFEGNPAYTLVNVSKGALMVVVGSRGHGGFAGVLLGSVSARVAELASCPVLVVHGEAPSTS
jgi:nucleotide-binding universal stress UspA family protein